MTFYPIVRRVAGIFVLVLLSMWCVPAPARRCESPRTADPANPPHWTVPSMTTLSAPQGLERDCVCESIPDDAASGV